MLFLFRTIQTQINEFNRKDLEKYESDIRLLKAQYEEGLQPANTVLQCNALKYYKGYLERSKSGLPEMLGVALPNLAHTNDELAFVEDEINKVCV